MHPSTLDLMAEVTRSGELNHLVPERVWAEIAGAEPFSAFEARVKGILDEAAEPGRRVLCLTSGGVISMALRIALGLDAERLETARDLVQTMVDVRGLPAKVEATLDGKVSSLIGEMDRLGIEAAVCLEG